MLEGRLQPGSILGSPMLSDGLGIMDHALQTGFEDVAHQNILPALTSTESGSQVTTPAQPIDNGTPVITNPLTQSTQVLQAPQVLDSQVEALQNHVLSLGKVPLQIDPHGGGATSPGGLVTDGGFESGLQLQGCQDGLAGSAWWCDDSTGFTGNFAGGAHSGNFAVSTGPVGILGRVAQIVQTAPSTNYQLSFWFADDGGTPNALHVEFDGVQVFAVDNEGAHGYNHITVNVTSSNGGDTGIVFNTRQDPAFLHIDDVCLMAGGGCP
jgi:hypothetical protein